MPRALPLAGLVVEALGSAWVLYHTGVPLHWVWAGSPAAALGVPAPLAAARPLAAPPRATVAAAP